MSNGKNHIQVLDYFRGIAILSVFFFHCIGSAFGHDHLAWRHGLADFSTPNLMLAFLPLTLGWAGVPIFFVVSGFCIHLSFAKDQANGWAHFFTRRFFRIYPPYFLALIYFVFMFPTTRLIFDGPASWIQFGSHLLLLHNFNSGTFFGTNHSFWSIAVEFQLYLLYPVLIFIVNQIGWRRALLFTGLLEVFIRGATGMTDALMNEPLPCWLSGSPFGYWFSWSIGAALADAYIKKQPLPFGSLSITALSSLAVGTNFIRVLNPFSFLFFALLTATILARVLAKPRPASNHAIHKHLRELGLYSYSFYLLHQPLLGLPLIFDYSFMPTDTLSELVLCICMYPFIFLLARTYYQYIELRSIVIGKQVLQRISPLPACA